MIGELECKRVNLWMFVLLVMFGLAPFECLAAEDTVSLHLTFIERNGLSGPSGQGDFAVGTAQATLATAGIVKAFGSLNDIFSALSSGKEIKVPKTTGESVRSMTDMKLAQKAAALPRRSGYKATIDATLAWNEAKKAYLVQSGTCTWDTYNRSTLQGGGHDFFTNLSASGTHKLKPEEIRIKYDGAKLSEALASKQENAGTYTLEVMIRPEPKAVVGNSGWIVGKGKIYESKERYTPGGVLVLTTDEYKPTPDGNDLMATNHRASDKRPPYLFEHNLSYKAEERTLQKGKGRFSEQWLDSTGVWNAISWSVYLPGDLVAIPGGPYAEERAESISIDGSESKGKIAKYEWTFVPVPDEEAGGESGDIGNSAVPAQALMGLASSGSGGGAGGGGGTGKGGGGSTPTPGKGSGQAAPAEKTLLGPKAKFINIKDIKAKLKVTDEQGQEDTDEAFIKAFPRNFEIKYDGKDEEAYLPLQKAALANLEIRPLLNASVTTGLNLCGGEPKLTDLSAWKTCDHYLHTPVPYVDGAEASYEDKAYKVAQVKDENSPWNEQFYVSELTVKIVRRAYISPYFLPDAEARALGALPQGAPTTWAQANSDYRKQEAEKGRQFSDDDFNAGAFVAMLWRHEHTHSQIIKEYVDEEGEKAARNLEKLNQPDRGLLTKAADGKVAAIDRELYARNKAFDDLKAATSKYSVLWQGGYVMWNGKAWVNSGGDPIIGTPDPNAPAPKAPSDSPPADPQGKDKNDDDLGPND